MELIKKIDTRRADNGHIHGWSLFYCPYCNKKVEKRYDSGLRNKSCGCVRYRLAGESITKHGCTRNGQRTKLYCVWVNMKVRCDNSNDPAYRNYGGRGITICDEWKNDYIIFKVWALNNGYKEGLTIERKDNDSNYEPSNCRWAIMREQSRNKRSNKLTMKKVSQIRSLYFNVKIEQKLLAKIFGVSSGYINGIVNNKYWV